MMKATRIMLGLPVSSLVVGNHRDRLRAARPAPWRPWPRCYGVRRPPLGDDSMALPLRPFLRLPAGAAALPAMSRTSCTQTYPARPVRWIVPFPPGGAADITARLIGQWMSEHTRQQFIVENRPGAGANIGTE